MADKLKELETISGDDDSDNNNNNSDESDRLNKTIK